MGVREGHERKMGAREEMTREQNPTTSLSSVLCADDTRVLSQVPEQVMNFIGGTKSEEESQRQSDYQGT